MPFQGSFQEELELEFSVSFERLPLINSRLTSDSSNVDRFVKIQNVDSKLNRPNVYQSTPQRPESSSQTGKLPESLIKPFDIKDQASSFFQSGKSKIIKNNNNGDRQVEQVRTSKAQTITSKTSSYQPNIFYDQTHIQEENEVEKEELINEKKITALEKKLTELESILKHQQSVRSRASTSNSKPFFDAANNRTAVSPIHPMSTPKSKDIKGLSQTHMDYLQDRIPSTLKKFTDKKIEKIDEEREQSVKTRIRLPDSLKLPFTSILDIKPPAPPLELQDAWNFAYKKRYVIPEVLEKVPTQVAAIQTDALFPQTNVSRMSGIKKKKDLTINTSLNLLILSSKANQDTMNKAGPKDKADWHKSFSEMSYQLMFVPKISTPGPKMPSIAFEPDRAFLGNPSIAKMEKIIQTEADFDDEESKRAAEEMRAASYEEFERLGNRVKALLRENVNLKKQLAIFSNSKKETIPPQAPVVNVPIPEMKKLPKNLQIEDIMKILINYSRPAPKTPISIPPTANSKANSRVSDKLPTPAKIVNQIPNSNRTSNERITGVIKNGQQKTAKLKIEDTSQLKLQSKLLFRTFNAATQTTGDIPKTQKEHEETAEALKIIEIDQLKTKIRYLEKQNKELELLKRQAIEDREKIHSVVEDIKRQIDAERKRANQTVLLYQEEKQRFDQKDKELMAKLDEAENETAKIKSKIAFVYEKLYEQHLEGLAEEMRRFGES